MFGILVLIIGLFFLLRNLGLITGNLWGIIWPLLIIIVGLKMMFRKQHNYWKDGCCNFGKEMHEKFHEKEQGQK